MNLAAIHGFSGGYVMWPFPTPMHSMTAAQRALLIGLTNTEKDKVVPMDRLKEIANRKKKEQ